MWVVRSGRWHSFAIWLAMSPFHFRPLIVVAHYWRWFLLTNLVGLFCWSLHWRVHAEAAFDMLVFITTVDSRPREVLRIKCGCILQTNTATVPPNCNRSRSSRSETVAHRLPDYNRTVKWVWDMISLPGCRWFCLRKFQTMIACPACPACFLFNLWWYIRCVFISISSSNHKLQLKCAPFNYVWWISFRIVVLFRNKFSLHRQSIDRSICLVIELWLPIKNFEEN